SCENAMGQIRRLWNTHKGFKLPTNALAYINQLWQEQRIRSVREMGLELPISLRRFRLDSFLVRITQFGHFLFSRNIISVPMWALSFSCVNRRSVRGRGVCSSVWRHRVNLIAGCCLDTWIGRLGWLGRQRILFIHATDSF